MSTTWFSARNSETNGVEKQYWWDWGRSWSPYMPHGWWAFITTWQAVWESGTLQKDGAKGEYPNLFKGRQPCHLKIHLKLTLRQSLSKSWTKYLSSYICRWHLSASWTELLRQLLGWFTYGKNTIQLISTLKALVSDDLGEFLIKMVKT